MAKKPKRRAPAARSKAGKKPAKAKKPKPVAARPTQKAQAQERPEAQHTAFYLDNKPRIDEALNNCVRHFKQDEHDIVRAVGRMLFKHYSDHRAKIPAGAPGVL